VERPLGEEIATVLSLSSPRPHPSYSAGSSVFRCGMYTNALGFVTFGPDRRRCSD
jgi:hypothetical protein